MNGQINSNLIYTFIEQIRSSEHISLLDNFINSSIYNKIIDSIYEHKTYHKRFVDVCINIIDYICMRDEIDRKISKMIKLIMSMESSNSISNMNDSINKYTVLFHNVKKIQNELIVTKAHIDSVFAIHDDTIISPLKEYIDNNTSDLLEYSVDIGKDFYNMLIRFYAIRSKKVKSEDLIHFMDDKNNIYLAINGRFFVNNNGYIMIISQEHFNVMCKKASYVYLTKDDNLSENEYITLLYYFYMNNGLMTIDMLRLICPKGIYTNYNSTLFYDDKFDMEISGHMSIKRGMIPNVSNSDQTYISIDINGTSEIFNLYQIENIFNIFSDGILWYMGKNKYNGDNCNVLICRHQHSGVYIVINPVHINRINERVLFLSYPIYEYTNIIIAATANADYYMIPSGKKIKRYPNNKKVLIDGKNKLEDEIIGIYMIDDGILNDEKWINAFLLLYGDVDIQFNPKEIRSEMNRLDIKYDDGIVNYENICMISDNTKFKKNTNMYKFYIDFVMKNEDNTCTLIYEISNIKLVFDYNLIRSIESFLDGPDWYISKEYIVAHSKEYNIQIILRSIR